MSRGLHAAALEALGDANRRAILEILAESPTAVQAIADRLPISRPAVSRHLRLLKGAGLVTDHPVGTARVYELRADGVEAIRGYFDEVWRGAAARLRLAAENVPRASPEDS